MAGILADAVLVVHAAFVVWVVAGGLAAWRWPWLAWLHLPAAAWGVWIEASGGICPLTPLEQRLRLAAGEAGYEGGFIAHYLQALLYPADLTRELQWMLAALAGALNAGIYLALAWRKLGPERRRRDAQGDPDRPLRRS